jgi:uncharacterized lipoprotein YajG
MGTADATVKLLSVLLLAGCATGPTTPEQMPEGIVCVSTLTTTVVTVGRVSSPMTISPDCAIRVSDK